MKTNELAPSSYLTDCVVQFSPSAKIDKSVFLTVPNGYKGFVYINEKLSFRVDNCNHINLLKEYGKDLLGQNVKVCFILINSLPLLAWGFGNIEIKNDHQNELYKAGANGKYALEIEDFGRLIAAYSGFNVVTIDDLREKTISVIKSVGAPILNNLLVDKEVAFRPHDALYVYVPYTTMMNRIVKQNFISSIIVRTADGFSTAVAEASITSLLKSRHGRKDFFMMSSDTIMKSINQATGTFTMLISAIAVISLLVGGIGVMNIMLVSVTERTREIGIRMAVGARQSDIMTQFLIESITVCIIGGLLGVVLSGVLGYVLSIFVPTIHLSFSVASVVVAVLTSSLIGVLFGYMPARSAARLNPIDALARE